MDIGEFRESLQQNAPPDRISVALQALWWDGNGKWNEAHEAAQQDEGPAGAWVHAYLHRKEGDLSNATYWYNRAGQEVGYGELQGEWEKIVATLLSN